MATRTPSARTKEALELAGWTVGKTEHWCPFSRRRKDLFNGLDFVAIRPGEILGVQATSKSNVSARVRKLKEEPRIRAWVDAGAKCEVWGWEGNDLRVVEINSDDFRCTEGERTRDSEADASDSDVVCRRKNPKRNSRKNEGVSAAGRSHEATST